MYIHTLHVVFCHIFCVLFDFYLCDVWFCIFIKCYRLLLLSLYDELEFQIQLRLPPSYLYKYKYDLHVNAPFT